MLWVLRRMVLYSKDLTFWSRCSLDENVVIAVSGTRQHGKEEEGRTDDGRSRWRQRGRGDSINLNTHVLIDEKVIENKEEAPAAVAESAPAPEPTKTSNDSEDDSEDESTESRGKMIQRHKREQQVIIYLLHERVNMIRN